MAVAYHYTTHAGLRGILRDGAIRPSPWVPSYGYHCPAGVIVPHDAQHVVWFSVRDDFEPGARKAGTSIAGTIHLLDEFELDTLSGIARIAVDESELLDWNATIAAAGVPASWAQFWADGDREIGAEPERDYRAHVGPFPIERALRIERLKLRGGVCGIPAERQWKPL